MFGCFKRPGVQFALCLPTARQAGEGGNCVSNGEWICPAAWLPTAGSPYSNYQSINTLPRGSGITDQTGGMPLDQQADLTFPRTDGQMPVDQPSAGYGTGAAGGHASLINPSLVNPGQSVLEVLREAISNDGDGSSQSFLVGLVGFAAAMICWCCYCCLSGRSEWADRKLFASEGVPSAEEDEDP